MAGSSIISSFQFKSYKVDRAEFSSKPELDILAQFNAIPSESMLFAVRVRQPVFFTAPKLYVGGVDVILKVLKPGTASDSEKDEDAVFKLELGIAGIFAVEGDRFPQDQEERLVKINIPALLMPYARAAMTGFLSSAGFGSVIFPVINVHELAKQQLKDVDIKIID